MTEAKTPLEMALAYLSRGWNPVPIPFRSKKPEDNAWQTRLIDEASAPHFFNGDGLQNVGVQMGPASHGLTDVDLDADEAVVIGPYLLPPTRSVFGRQSKRASHREYYSDLSMTYDGAALQLKTPEGKMIVELRIGGGDKGAQTIFPGSVHKETGEPIQWEEDGEPASVDGNDLLARVKLVAAAALIARKWPSQGGRHNAARCIGGFLARAGVLEERIKLVAQAIARAANDEEWKDRVTTARDAAQEYHDGGHAFGLTHLTEIIGKPAAKRVADWLDYDAGSQEAPKATEKKGGRSKNKAGAPAGLQDNVALDFAALLVETFRFVAIWNRWMQWEGHRWRVEDTLAAFDEARTLCRAAGDADAKTVAAVVILARSDRRLAATSEQWDRDKWLLGTTDGVVDLKTGKLRPSSPEDYVTKVTTVAPGGDCPLWRQFLERVTGKNAELEKFLQRVCGYALTGDTSEDALFFFYGTGANGKSVFLRTIAGILGDHHTTASMEMFTVSNSERHPTDLADLRGARLVTAIETEEGKRWDEAKIKALTGGDRIKARFMRQDFFEYTPQFKLLIAGNHRPSIRTIDEAIRRRMNLIPFTVTIPEEERDPALADKLKAEWPGILAWMIEGCMSWQRKGLQPPEAVVTATEEYLEDEDALKAFIDENCETGKHRFDSINSLWNGWKVWAEQSGEYVGSKRKFGQKLVDKGFPRTKGTKGRRNHLGIFFAGSAYFVRENL
jgi:P4 family phage/plasmid primase-like protien